MAKAAGNSYSPYLYLPRQPPTLPGSQESELIAPATASFPWGLYGVTSLNRVVHQVNSYVDAQNSFGAKVRTYFSCEVPGFGDDI